MPSYWNEDFEDLNQDWEPVILKKSDKTVISVSQPPAATPMHMKVKDYIKLEKGLVEPNNQQLSKIRKYLNIRI